MMLNCTHPANQVCHGEQVRCPQGGCIEPEQVCDFSNDCEDWADEKACSGYSRCNFENGKMCSTWVQDIEDDFDLMFGPAESWSAFGGPGMDHTYNNFSGSYAYGGPGRPAKPPVDGLTDKAKLISPVIYPSTPPCTLRLWFAIMKDVKDELQIYSKEVTSGNEVHLHTVKYNGEEGWRKVNVKPQVGHPYNIITILERANYELDSALAMDDISFDQHCLIGSQCATAGQLCDFVAQCSDSSDEANCKDDCDFEEGFCGWTSSINKAAYYKEGREEVHWIVLTGSENSGNPAGPANDHTTGNPDGHFAILNSSHVFTQEPKLEGRVHQNAAAECNLMYHAHVKSEGVADVTLSMDLVLLSDDDIAVERILLDKIGIVVEEWISRRVGLGRRRGKFRIEFKVNTLEIVAGLFSVAIDDIGFEGCAMPQPESLVDECPPNFDFRCANKVSVFFYFLFIIIR